MQALRRIRAQKRMTLQELSEAAGVTIDTISAFERGRRTPRPITLFKIADALGVDVDELEKDAVGSSDLKVTPLSSEEEWWTAYVNSLDEDELKELKEELNAEVARFTYDLERSDLGDVAEIDRQIKVMEQLRKVKERLPIVERALALDPA